MKKFLFIIISFISLSLTGQHMKIEILPSPQFVKIIDDNNSFILTENIAVSFNHKELSKHKSIKEIFVSLFGDKADFTFDYNKPTEINLKLIEQFNSTDSIPNEFVDEAYTLEISSTNIIAEAITVKGLYYAAQSLSQIFNNYGRNAIPLVKIIDFPDMKTRGISDDISRGQVSTVANFKRIIKFISEYKMNTYMPYMEDLIQFDSFPEIGVGRGALSKDEIKEIVKYADEHFVEVIPVFQTLGHFENILSQHEFIKYADFPGAASLDVTNHETYIFLETMLNEVFELFPSEYIHIGADESYDVGYGNSRSIVEQTSLTEVHADHYQKIYNICKKNDKKVMMYGDIILSHPEILERIPKDIIIVDWHYFPRFEYPSTKIFSDAGFNFIVSPSVWNFNASFPENFLAVPNIETLTRSGIENNSIGMINSCWGDYGSETFRELNFYGYAWSAQCSWSINKSAVDDFQYMFFKNFYGTNDNKIGELYRELSNPTNQVLWNDLWRHPLLAHRQQDWRAHKFPYPSKLFWMNYGETNSFEDLNKSVSKNKEHLDLLLFSNKLKDYYALKIKTQNQFQRKMNGEYVNEIEMGNNIEKNIESLRKLKEVFSELWLRYNKDANLWMVEDKFSRMIEYFEEIKIDLEDSKLESAELESKCVYFPTDNDTIISNASFKKDIEIKSDIQKAHIQFFTDGHAKLYINDNFMDEVYVKRSGSLWIEQQRVKLIDVEKHLRKGINEIRVEAVNYKNKMACCNVIGEISIGDSTIDIYSDSTWLASDDGGNNWVQVGVDEESNKNIAAPNFNKLRKSWIER